MVATLFLTLIMVISLFSQGLYDPSQSLPLLMLVLLVTLFVWIYVCVIKKEKLSHTYLILCIFPMLYIFSLVGGVESVEGTLMRFLQWSLYPCFLFLLLVVKEKGSNRLELALVVFSYAFVVITYLFAFRMIPSATFWLELNEDISGLGMRLAGFFQYPNAFGIVAASLLFYHFMHAVHETRPRWEVIHSLPILSYGLFLLLTESRGAMLCFLVCWVIGIWIVEKNQLFRYVSLSIVLGIMLFVISWFLPLMVKGQSMVLLLIIGLSAVYSLLSKRIKAIPISRPVLIPLAMTVLVVSLVLDIGYKGFIYRMLPEVLQSRVSMGAGTLQERFLYVQDVMTEIDRFFLNGAGGMAWKSLMYQTQSQPYISHELHNGYINMLVETGIPGFLLLVLLIGYATVYMIRRRSLYFLSFLVIVLHSTMDFSLSYGFIACLLLLFFAAAYDRVNKGLPKAFELIGIGIFIFTIIGSLAFSYRFIQAEKMAHSRELEQAITYNPYQMSYRLELANMNENKRMDLIKEGLKYEPNHSYAIFQLAKWNEEVGNNEQAQRLYRRSISLDRFDSYKHEGYLRFLVNQSEMEREKGRIKQSEEWADKAVQAYKDLQRLAEKYPLPNQRNFRVTEDTTDFIRNLQK